jgi:hypothetical protein
MALFAPHRFLSNKSPIHFAGESGNRNTFLNGKWHIQNENGHSGPRLMPNNCKNLNLPYFSLPTTFKCIRPAAGFQVDEAPTSHPHTAELFASVRENGRIIHDMRMNGLGWIGDPGRVWDAATYLC